MAKKMTQPTDFDRKVRLVDLTGFVARIAGAMIDRHGFYTFTDFEGRKVLVVR